MCWTGNNLKFNCRLWSGASNSTINSLSFSYSYKHVLYASFEKNIDDSLKTNKGLQLTERKKIRNQIFGTRGLVQANDSVVSEIRLIQLLEMVRNL